MKAEQTIEEKIIAKVEKIHLDKWNEYYNTYYYQLDKQSKLSIDKESFISIFYSPPASISRRYGLTVVEDAVADIEDDLIDSDAHWHRIGSVPGLYNKISEAKEAEKNKQKELERKLAENKKQKMLEKLLKRA